MWTIKFKVNEADSQKCFRFTGGDRIHQIQKDSGAAGIRMEKHYCMDKGYVPVHITGTLQQIQAAKILLKKAILESSQGKKTLKKAVEINEKEIVTNELPKEVKTEKSNFWFIEQEIKTLDSGLQRAKVIIHDKGAAVIIGPGNNGDFLLNDLILRWFCQREDC